MKLPLLLCALIILSATGCISKSKADAQARDAFHAGLRKGMSMAAQGPSIWIMGNVKTPVVPWKPELTLTKALVAAEYRGAKDPSEIIVQRKGQEPLRLRA
jgi:hypothetical protein